MQCTSCAYLFQSCLLQDICNPVTSKKKYNPLHTLLCSSTQWKHLQRHRTELRPVQKVYKIKYKICISRNATLKFLICRIIWIIWRETSTQDIFTHESLWNWNQNIWKVIYIYVAYKGVHISIKFGVLGGNSRCS